MSESNEVIIMAFDGDGSARAQYKTDEDCVREFTSFMNDTFNPKEIEGMYSGDIGDMFMAFAAGRKSVGHAADLAEAKCAFHHLKAAIAAVEVCGVPIHHLSHELAKHFDVQTHDFVKEIKAQAIEEFGCSKQAVRDLNELCPFDGSEQMQIGWKSGVVDVRNYCFTYAKKFVRECGDL